MVNSLLRFRNVKNNVFTEEANKFSLSSDKIKEGNQLI